MKNNIVPGKKFFHFITQNFKREKGHFSDFFAKKSEKQPFSLPIIFFCQGF
jgi:hypothetical protein